MARRSGTAGVPAWISPQLTQLIDTAPDGDQWLHEIKYDGHRMHARLDRGRGEAADPNRARLDAQISGGRQAAENPVQWLFLDLNGFFASCEQQENPSLRGQPIIVVQTLTDSAVAIAASYAAKTFRIKTGTLVRDARQLCPGVAPVQANHRLYTEYHERILKAVDTCLPPRSRHLRSVWERPNDVLGSLPDRGGRSRCT